MDAIVSGIDVSKERLDVAVRPTGESLAFNRTAAGIEDLVAWLRALSPKMVAIEATGGFEAVVAAGLAGAGLPVVVVNPAQVRAFAQALGKRAKTDPIDAGGDRPLRRGNQAGTAANAGRDDETSGRSGRSPAPDR